MGKRGKDGLVSKVSGFIPFKDKKGRKYIAYCDFSAHRGVVLRPEVCETRRCHHYYKMYLQNENREFN